jgi:glycosyltransferase involved in cell wall biosynthesis/GT2 family glycosyltransferase
MSAARLCPQTYPLIGVVTPVRNRKRYTVMLAEQLALQDYPLFKIFIVDSASTDGTSEAVGALPIEGLSVVPASSAAYWTEATNVGVAQALETGCEYILTLNDDAIVPTNLISTLVEAALETGERLIGSVISFANEPGRLWGVGAYNDWAAGAFLQTGQANLWEDVLRRDGQECDGKLIGVECLCGNGTLVHKSVFEEIGLYDRKHTPHYHADAEFTLRAAGKGVRSWVARNARLYNRFTEEGDGPLASKNIRFFSLRSANFIRPIFYILQEYCPREQRVIALCRYLSRYLPAFAPRQRSKLLRAMGYLCEAPGLRTTRLSYFLPPLDAAMMSIEDLDILQHFPPQEFVVASYMYLLRRACDDSELNNYTTGLARGMSYNAVLSEIANSEEYRRLPDAQPWLFMEAAISGFESEPLKTNDSELTVIAFTKANRRLPTRREFDIARTVFGRADRAPFATNYGATSSDESNDRLATGEVLAPTVYVNIDVLCMAVSDPRARTGVHRYVSAIVRELASDPRVHVQVFFSPQFDEQWPVLAEKAPLLRRLKFKGLELARRRVLFYPYFPHQGADVRFKALPTFVMLHDLFPLTNPEWFTAEATRRFRRATRLLVEADHIFCNSDSTRTQLRQVFPDLKASASVAYLGVDPAPAPASAEQPIEEEMNRYFLCVGTLEPRKNLENVLRAYALLQENSELKEIRMFVVGQAGWNIDREHLSNLIGRHENNVKFLGNVSDTELWALYRGAICTVFPSLAEGFGLPVIESFACGVPVVTSNRSSMAEIADGGAILVNPLDPADIAAAITTLATDQERRNALSGAARSHAAGFSWKGCADAHIIEFQRVLEAHDVSSPPAFNP